MICCTKYLQIKMNNLLKNYFWRNKNNLPYMFFFQKRFLGCCNLAQRKYFVHSCSNVARFNVPYKILERRGRPLSGPKYIQISQVHRSYIKVYYRTSNAARCDERSPFFVSISSRRIHFHRLHQKQHLQTIQGPLRHRPIQFGPDINNGMQSLLFLSENAPIPYVSLRRRRR